VIIPIESELNITEPGHGAHDAVRFEDSNLAIGTEAGGHGPERMRLQKSRRLAQFALKAGMAAHLACLGFVIR